MKAINTANTTITTTIANVIDRKRRFDDRKSSLTREAGIRTVLSLLKNSSQWDRERLPTILEDRFQASDQSIDHSLVSGERISHEGDCVFPLLFGRKAIEIEAHIREGGADHDRG